MGHLSKLQSEYGKKGLVVIAITGEDKATNLRYMVHQDPGFAYRVAIGGAPGYEMPGVPYAFLIDAEGKIVYRGSPGGLSKKKVLLPALKDVRDPTPEEVAARSAKMLAFAEAFADDGLYLRAEQAFDALIDRFPDSEGARTAAERKKALLDDDAARAEHDAQQRIARIVGGVEGPDPEGKRLKGKQIEAAARKLEKLAEDLAESAPRSARLAAEWQAIFATPWE